MSMIINTVEYSYINYIAEPLKIDNEGYEIHLSSVPGFIAIHDNEFYLKYESDGEIAYRELTIIPL